MSTSQSAGAAEQIGGNHAGRVVTGPNDEDRKARRAHRLEHTRLVGARRKLRRPGIAIDCPRTAGRCRVDGEVEDVAHLLHVVEDQRPSLRQAQSARLLQHGVA